MKEETPPRNLFIHQWIPENPRALVFILHGIFEHAGRYKHLADFLNKSQIALVAADHYGHGRSPGVKGYIDAWENLINDSSQWISRYKSLYPGIPYFLLGHSLGGLLAVSYLLDSRPGFQGVILLSAALKVSKDVSPVLQKLAPVLAAVFPKLKTITLDASAISRDQEVVKNYQEDPYVYTDRVHAQTGNETLQATKNVKPAFPDFDWPVLILHGTADRLTEPDGSQQFYDQIQSTDKTLHFYEGWYHELLNEPEKDKVMEAIRIWITSRI